MKSRENVSEMKLNMVFIAVLVGVVLLMGCTQQGGAAPNATGGSQTPPSTSGSNPSGGTSGNTGSGGSTQTAPNSVTILNFAYDPATITVSKGTTITWTNKDPTAHTVTGTGFDSGSIAPEGVYTHTFNETGTFPYGCTFHPNMHGTVVVQ
jgi:plastocyanin